MPVSLTDVTEELGEEVEAPLQDEKAELKLLQFPKPVSGRRSDTNFNKTSTTKTSSSTLPQHQVLRYLNIKFYATSTKTQNAGGEKEDASESRHGGENEDENNKDKSFKKADSTSQPKTIITTSPGSCMSCDATVSKTSTKKKTKKK